MIDGIINQLNLHSFFFIDFIKHAVDCKGMLAKFRFTSSNVFGAPRERQND